MIPIPFESPASVVSQDLLNLSVRSIFSSRMTSENASGDASQGKIPVKTASLIPDNFFFNVCARAQDPVHSGH